VDAVIKGTDSGENYGTGILEALGRFLNGYIGTNLEQRLMDAFEVAGAVIEERYHGPKLGAKCEG